MQNEDFRILLIEDNPGDARLILEMFKEDEQKVFDVVVAECLQSGLTYLNKSSFDVIVLDPGLPDSKGLSTVIKTVAAAPLTPVVLLTGFNDQKNGLEAVRLGAQDYLVKGQIDNNILQRVLRYAIERKKQKRQCEGPN